MSGNQSRFDKSDFKKTGRSGNSSGAYQKSYSNKSAGGAGGGFGPPPVSTNRSFKKTNNAPGGQPAVNSQPTVAPSRNPHNVQHNGIPEQQPIRGPPGTAVSEVASRVYDSSSSQRNNQAVPKPPASQSSTMSSDTKSPMTPVKEDTPKPIAVQFGSISPGFIHGMQIPARTSSAPPNLDEQKRNQARIDSLRTGPTAPVPAIPKQQLPEKEAGVSKQIQVVEPHSVPRIKKESQVSSAPSSSLPQKPSSIPMSGIPLQAAFHQQPVHLPYGGPNPPIQPQGIPGASMHMPLPMHYPMASAPQLQHQMYMPNIQPHPMQHQGMMHQGQGMIFPAQMGPHMSHQLGNVGMNMHPQYAPQQAGKFATARKSVVITHPETREELKLDKRGDKHGDGGLPGPRPHSNVPVNSQTIQSYTSGPSPNFYPNSFSNSPFSVPASSFFATSAQGTPSTHAPRFNPGSQNPHASGFGSSPASSKVTISVSAPSELVKSERGNDTQVAGSAVPASRKASVGSYNVSGQSLGTVAVKAESPKLGGQGDTKQKLSGVDSDKASRILIRDLKSSYDVSTVPVSPVAAGTIQDSAPIKSNVEGNRVESTKNPLMKLEEKGSTQDQPQGGALSASTPSPLGIINHIKSSGTDTEENVDSKSDIISSKTSHDKSTYRMELSLNGRTTTHGSSGSDEVNEKKQLSRSVDDEIEQKIALPTHAATHGEKKGPADCCTNAGTDATNYGLSRTESEHSSVDNVEIRELLDKPTSEAAVSSNSPNVNSVTHEFSPSSDKGYHLDAVLSTDPEDAMKNAITDHDLTLRNCGGDDTNIGDVASSFSVIGFKDKMLPDQNRLKSSSSKGKIKRKESLQKADAAGTSSDLYMAYKASEEHKETGPSVQPAKTGTVMNEMKKTPGDTVTEGSDTREGGAHSKGEPDDWEDVADAATPKVGGPDNSEQKLIQHESENFTKKYSIDFLLKFQAQYCDLPEGSSIAPNVANVLLFPNANKCHNDRDSYPSPGRHPGGSRPDRHGPIVDDDKWSKVQVHFVHNRDHVNGAGGFRPVQGGNFGVLRNPRQAPGHFPGVNNSGPTQSINAMIRNNNEADRWQRGSSFQKGLIPSPQIPSQLMHKAEKKYEIGKVADEEQAKQRRLKGILNKLTPQNFEKLFEQVKAVNIDSADTLTGVISQIFDKALMEPTFCEMYADFCYHLSGELPDFSEENKRITFKILLLNKCQDEFQRGEREQEEANRSEDSEMTQTKEEREERRVQARRRMLGNIRLIGELFKKKMLTERIMHECIKKLLGQHQNPDEEDIEALCKLMSTIGEMIDHPVAKPHMDAYFDMMGMLSVDMNLSSRVRFMLKDAIDLRKNKWQQRRKVEGPKKIEEVHRDAAHERQAQANRTRGPGINASGRRGPPPEFGSRGSNTVSSPSSHSGNFRGYPSHSRGFGNQDIRSEDRQPSFESRTLSVPLRTVRDDTITLGPQGGLARGMSSRGSASSANTPPIDRPLSSGESRRREAVGYNGNNSVTERPTSSSSEDAVGRSAPERYGFLASHDKHGEQDRDFHSDRESRNAGSGSEKTSTSSGKALPVELLQDKSLAAIKEFYSAKDEKEVTLCISELNSPSFYPSMIALWVTDSFERKDMHRDLLTRLLINLSKPPSGILSQQDILKGFESVLENLEDAVNDAPKAPEFLGHILGKSIVENIVPLVDISRVLHEGGEEPGTLLESGLAGDVLGIILEVIQSEKGDSVMNQILSGANLHLEDFRPPGPMKSKKLDKFINVGMTFDG